MDQVEGNRVTDAPSMILTVCLWTYWTTVLTMALVSRRRHRQEAGLWPSRAHERVLWTVWVPLIVAWNLLPLLAQRTSWTWFRLPDTARSAPDLIALRLAAAMLAVGCCLTTAYCWRQMGKSWSIAIIPGEKRGLVRTGPFAFVRHPIYALSMALVVLSAAIVASPAMLVLAGIHTLLMQIKARGEEAHLLTAHGSDYADYCRNTGRFLPRFYPRSHARFNS
jgi:protein-S-isoprenylcysteine O-methyltransferase Ste14